MGNYSHTHNNNSSHTTLSHNSLTHNSLTHTQLSHTTLSHNSLTHNNSLTTLTHTTYSHTHNSNSLTHFEASTSNLCGRHGTWGYRPSFYVAGAALISLHSVWQLRRLVTSTFILCGPVAPRLFVWQAWHLEASTSILCGRQAWHLATSTHLLSLSCLSHPVFTFLLLLIGRSWHVGLSSPLIVCVLIFVHVDLSALFLFCVTEMDGGGVGK